MPKALLIQPWIYDFAAFDLWACPLGLLSLGAMLRAGGWEIAYLDCLDRFHPAIADHMPPEKPFHVGKYYAEEVPKPEALAWVPRRFKRHGLPPKVVEREMQDMPRPDVILVTSRMTYWYLGVAEVIVLCRRLFPDVPVALGGTYATLCPDHARAVCRPDAVVRGEGEPQLDGLLRSLTGRGLEGAGVGAGGAGADWSPVAPAFDLLRNRKAIGIETSRGCPYSCTYCASSILVPRYRRKPLERVVGELLWAVGELGAEDIAFHDDALLLDSAHHFLPLADAVLARKVRARFHTPNGLFANEITAPVAERLKALGVETIRLSLESNDEDRLRRLRRRVFPRHFTEAVRHLHAAGFTPRQIGVYLLAGLPGQSIGEVRDSIDFVIAQGASPYLAEYSPIPGTAEWPRAVAEARRPIAEEPLLQNNTIYALVSRAMPIEELERLKNYAVDQRNRH
jgi:radical SAM superfamily enzyme YgiQ (UPF0313 family)